MNNTKISNRLYDYNEVSLPADYKDAVGRLRVSQAYSSFDGQLHYGQLHHNFIPVLTTGGTATNNLPAAALTLAVTATAGSKVISRSRRQYYVSGQGQLIMETFNFIAPDAGIRRSVGYNDNEDGMRLEQIGSVVSCVLRSSVSGAPIDTAVAQADWNIDKMDGTGPSGVTIDWTKTQLVAFDFIWQGVGDVTFYLDVDRTLIPIHKFKNTNTMTVPYMSNPNLPCSYEIENISSGTVASMLQICASVFTEGGKPKPQVVRSTSSDYTVVSCKSSSSTHVISIRPAALFQGIANKGMCILINISVKVTNTVNAHFEILEDCVVTGTFTAHGAVDSMMEICKGTAGKFTGGISRAEGYAAVGGAAAEIGGADFYQLEIDPTGAPDVLTVVAGGVGGTTTVVCSIQWEEYY